MKKTGLGWKVKESKKVIKAAVEKWSPNIGVAFTGRKDSSVMMHMILKTVKRSPSAMFIDHGLHFDESYKQLKKLISLWKLDVNYEANEELLEKLNKERKIDRKKKLVTDLKIRTIEDTIKKYKWNALITAVRWDEHPARAGEVYFSKRKTHWRVHPMLHWKEKDIWSYIKSHKIPYNPLYDQGYRSIGEKPFTKHGIKDEDERSGREKEKEEIMERLRALGYF